MGGGVSGQVAGRRVTVLGAGVAGLAVAFIAILADRMIAAKTRKEAPHV